MKAIPEFDRLKLIEARDTVFFPSDFKFLSEHKGLRPGELHVLLSTAGAGKSSLVKSVMFDLAKKAKVLYWLSEEGTRDFRSHIACNAIPDSKIKNVEVYSELEDDSITDKEGLAVIKKMAMVLDEIKPDILIYDNLTTSLAYADLKPSIQYRVMLELKRMAIRRNIPILCVAHTKGEINMYNQGLISGNDIRGGKNIVMLVEYLYVFQKLSIAGDYFNFINIEKHRSQPVKNKFFCLEYSPKTGGYVQDWPIDFECMKENYGQRNILK